MKMNEQAHNLTSEEVCKLVEASKFSRIQPLRDQKKYIRQETQRSNSGYGLLGNGLYSVILRASFESPSDLRAGVVYAHEDLAFYTYKLGTPEQQLLEQRISTGAGQSTPNLLEVVNPEEELDKIKKVERVLRKAKKELGEINILEIIKNGKFTNIRGKILVGSISPRYLVYLRRDADCQDEDAFFDFHIYDGEIPVFRRESFYAEEIERLFPQKSNYPEGLYSDKDFRKHCFKYNIFKNKKRIEGIKKAKAKLRVN